MASKRAKLQPHKLKSEKDDTEDAFIHGKKLLTTYNSLSKPPPPPPPHATKESSSHSDFVYDMSDTESWDSSTERAEVRQWNIDEKIADTLKYSHDFVRFLSAKDFDFKYIQEHGFDTPIVFKDKSGLGMRVPSANFKGRTFFWGGGYPQINGFFHPNISNKRVCSFNFTYLEQNFKIFATTKNKH